MTHLDRLPLALLIALTITTGLRADDAPPAPALPKMDLDERREELSRKAVEFARTDSQRAQAQAAEATKQAQQPAAQLPKMQKALADAKVAQSNAVKAAATAAVELTAATKAKPIADKALVVAKQAFDAATKAATTATQAAAKAESDDKKKADDAKLAADKALTEKKTAFDIATTATATAAKRLTVAAAGKKQADVAKLAADKQVVTATTPIKPATVAKAAADKVTLVAVTKAKAAADKVVRYEKTPPVADPKSIKLVATWKHTRAMIACRIDSTGEHVFAGAQDNALHRWNLHTNAKTTFAGHKSWIRRFALHESSNLLVTGAYTGRVMFWNPLEAAPTAKRTIEAHKGYVRGVAISPDGKYVATGGNDALLRVWSAADGKLVTEIADHDAHFPDPMKKAEDVYRNHVYNVAFSPDGKYLASGDLVGQVKLWEVATWKPVRDLDAGLLHKFDPTFRAHIGGIRSMEFSPDGQQLVVAGIAKVSNAFAGIGVPTAVLFDVATGKQLAVMTSAKATKGTLWGVRFHPSGEFIVGAAGSSGGWLAFWKTGETKSFFDFKLPGDGYDVSFHPDGMRLVTALYDKTVRMYDIGPKPPAPPKKPAAKKAAAKKK